MLSQWQCHLMNEKVGELEPPKISYLWTLGHICLWVLSLSAWLLNHVWFIHSVKYRVCSSECAELHGAYTKKKKKKSVAQNCPEHTWMLPTAPVQASYDTVGTSRSVASRQRATVLTKYQPWLWQRMKRGNDGLRCSPKGCPSKWLTKEAILKMITVTIF